MILLGKDVQYWDLYLFQIHRAPTDADSPMHQSILLVKVLDKLAEGLPGLIRAVEDPLLHAQEVL